MLIDSSCKKVKLNTYFLWNKIQRRTGNKWPKLHPFRHQSWIESYIKAEQPPELNVMLVVFLLHDVKLKTSEPHVKTSCRSKNLRGQAACTEDNQAAFTSTSEKCTLHILKLWGSGFKLVQVGVCKYFRGFLATSLLQYQHLSEW